LIEVRLANLIKLTKEEIEKFRVVGNVEKTIDNDKNLNKWCGVFRVGDILRAFYYVILLIHAFFLFYFIRSKFDFCGVLWLAPIVLSLGVFYHWIFAKRNVKK